MAVKGKEVEIAASARLDAGTDIIASKIVIGENAVIGKGFKARVAGTLDIGKATVIRDTAIHCRNASIGANNYIDGVHIEGAANSHSQNVRIGNENLILQHTRINCNDDVFIGNDVGIGQYVEIWTHGSFMDVLAGYPYTAGPVKVGDHVWITAHSTIMPGVTVGNNVIIGNGTLVNRDVPGGCFFAGMPGRVVKENCYPPVITMQQQEAILGSIIQDYLETCEKKGFLPTISRSGLDMEYQSPEGAKAVFHTGERKITGGTDVYIEDFRDYLRFRGVKFFSDMPFKSIPPLDFQELDK